MHRFRGTDVGWGVLAIVINVALVVGVVLLLSGRDASEVAEKPPPPSPTASPTPSASPSASPSATTTEALFAREAPTTVAVLGDQTGDGQGEWVGILGELLGRDRRVTVHRLDPADPTVYAQKQAYGSTGPVVTIYNGSRPGALADYGARRLGFLSPKAPDVVVLNYGRNDDADKVAARLTTTTKALRKAWPRAVVTVTLQPPTADDAAKDVRDAVAAWAGTSGVRTLDVAKVFLDTGEPNSYVSSRDGLVMSGRGDRFWGQTAYRLLVGSEPPEAAEAATTGTPAEGEATPTSTPEETEAATSAGSRPRRTSAPQPTATPTPSPSRSVRGPTIVPFPTLTTAPTPSDSTPGETGPADTTPEQPAP
ncbi:GDSL-type esterase/lipase family protein [Knoellia sp. CPCC 206450]|uniref:GDSL-type esterase/lipase family protein n=1 Tax=Knoellia tibetensis TaxID=3404798 RepID=UPI003B439706